MKSQYLVSQAAAAAAGSEAVDIVAAAGSEAAGIDTAGIDTAVAAARSRRMERSHPLVQSTEPQSSCHLYGFSD